MKDNKKKVLIITSSTRKNGNSDILAQQFAKGAEDSNNSVEIIHLRNYKIDFCLGCWACTKLNKCIQKDDFNDLWPKMMDADVICFSAPTYFYSIDGRMKTFFDRCVTIYGKMSNKDFYYLTSAQTDYNEDIESVFVTFHGFARCFSNIHEKGRIYGTNSDNKGDVKKTDAYNEAFEMGKKISDIN